MHVRVGFSLDKNNACIKKHNASRSKFLFYRFMRHVRYMQFKYESFFLYRFPRYSDMNECAPAPCKNGATCVNLVGRYRCDCAPGFIGVTCEGIHFLFIFNLMLTFLGLII